ncbi:hypothetical protein CC79DRAFT_172836 [Sarocladium strictum]
MNVGCSASALLLAGSLGQHRVLDGSVRPVEIEILRYRRLPREVYLTCGQKPLSQWPPLGQSYKRSTSRPSLLLTGQLSH